jgi:hypothetical protein
MARSVLEQYQVADFIEWYDAKRLTLNPDFQRRSVWTPDGKSYLIDTLLSGLPMPKVYMRTVVDVVSQKSVRDIVDGQQRIRAILDFAKGHLRLNKRAGEYAALRYEDLDEETKQQFLAYAISVEQLVNASDDDVLQVFARLNSYTVPLNQAELRHAKYQGDFKWKVREVATGLAEFWRRYGILSTRDRLRMLDDQLTAEMFGVVLEGVRDGGQPKINALYDRHDPAFPDADGVASRVRSVVQFIDTKFKDAMQGEVFSRPPQVLILFAAIAHALQGIPSGDLGSDLPARDSTCAIDIDTARDNLALLTEAVLGDSLSRRFIDFVKASSGSTQRIASRRVRFLFLWRALTQPI